MSKCKLIFGMPLALVVAWSTATLHGQGPPAKIDVAQPKKADADRILVQKCTIEPFESVRLYSRAPGILKQQMVDIGDRVQRGQVLAVIDAPELEGEARLSQIAVVKARARVDQAKAGVQSAIANLESLEASRLQAEASAQGAAAMTRYREQQYKRIKMLFDAKTVEERLLDESRNQFEAARAAEKAADAAIRVAQATTVVAARRVDKSKALVVEMEADVKLAETKLDIAQIRARWATITSPIDGVITQRSFFPGDLIRTNPPGEPLLTIERFDLLRLVVNVPERDAVLVDRGDAATLEVNAFPGKKWNVKVSRIGYSEDPRTRTLRVELDLPNPGGQVRPGMTGTVSIAIGSKKD